MEVLNQFVEDIVADKLKPFVKSEAVPESQKGPMLIAVGKTLGGVMGFGEQGLGRGSWQSGRIVEVFRGTGGLVRSARVATAEGVLHRPAAKLAALDIQAEEIQAPEEGQDVDEPATIY